MYALLQIAALIMLMVSVLQQLGFRHFSEKHKKINIISNIWSIAYSAWSVASLLTVLFHFVFFTLACFIIVSKHRCFCIGILFNLIKSLYLYSKFKKNWS